MLLSQDVQTVDKDFIVRLPVRRNRARATADGGFDGRPKEKPRRRCRRGLAWAPREPESAARQDE